jgi:hypothetical protein
MFAWWILPHVHRKAKTGFVLSCLIIVGVTGVFVLCNPSLFVTRWFTPLCIVSKVNTPSPETPAQANEKSNLDERAWYIDAAQRMIYHRPVLGIGAGNFTTTLYHLLPNHLGHYVYQPVHNILYLATAELGALGGLLWLVFLCVPIGATLCTRRAGTIELITYTAAITSLGVIGFFDYYLWAAPHGRLLFALVSGLWISAYRKKTAPSENPAKASVPQ